MIRCFTCDSCRSKRGGASPAPTRLRLRQSGWTPLHKASGNGHVECVELLLASGAVIDAPSETGETSLHFAAAFGQADCAEALLSRGAEMDSRNKWGQAPLHVAAINWQPGRPEVVSALLDRGADPEARTKDLWTPLHCASLNGHADCIDLLLERGADPEARNAEGTTPLEVVEGDELLGEEAREVIRKIFHERMVRAMGRPWGDDRYSDRVIEVAMIGTSA